MRNLLKKSLSMFMAISLIVSINMVSVNAEGTNAEGTIELSLPRDYNPEGTTLVYRWDSTNYYYINDNQNNKIFEMFTGDKITTHVRGNFDISQCTLDVFSNNPDIAEISIEDMGDYSNIVILFKDIGDITITAVVSKNNSEIGRQNIKFHVITPKQTTAKINKSLRVGNSMPSWVIENPIYGSEYKIERNLNNVTTIRGEGVKGSYLQYITPKYLYILERYEYFVASEGVYTESLYVKTPGDTDYKLLAREDITVFKPSYVPKGWIEKNFISDDDDIINDISIIAPAKVLENYFLPLVTLIKNDNTNYKKEYEELESKFGDGKFLLYDINVFDYDRNTIQPSMFENCSYFKVRIPIPKDFDHSKLAVYYIDSNGNLINMNGEIDGDYIIFNAEHFSLYSIVQDMSIKTDEKTPSDTSPSDTSSPDTSSPDISSPDTSFIGDTDSTSSINKNPNTGDTSIAFICVFISILSLIIIIPISKRKFAK